MKNIFVSISFLFSSLAFAQSIGPAGCGLGNMAFGSSKNQVLASTTNDIVTSNLFGITSGTSNCEDKSGMAKLDAFVDANKVALADDMARGQGETLTSIGTILNCSDMPNVQSVLKSNYSVIFSSPAPQDVSQRIREVLKSHEVACVNVI